MKYIIPVFLISLTSGCWFGNTFSNDCDPTSCEGSCVDNICVIGSTSNNTNNVSDMGLDQGEEDMQIDKIACMAHADCGQTPDLAGDQLCVAGFCETLLFTEGDGACEELFVGDGVQLDAAPENTLIIPVVTSITGDAAPVNQRRGNNAFKLATEFANTSGGFGQRKVVLVICDDNTNPTISQEIGRKLLDRTGAISYIGANFVGGLSTTVTPPVTDRGVLAFVNSTDIGYATLIDGDLAFRNLPSEQLSIDAIEALVERYQPAEIGLFYREDDPVLNVEGLTMAQQLTNFPVTVGKFSADDFDDAVQTVRGATSGLRPVEMLIAIGRPAELPEVINAYKNSLADGFNNGSPRVLVPTVDAFAIPGILGVDVSLTPNRVEMTTGAANTTDAFRDFFVAKYEVFDEVAPSLFDSAMFVLMAHAAAPDATSGAELRDIIRERFVSDDSGVDIIASSPTAFSEAASALSNNQNIRYFGAAGGAPVLFDNNGDVPYFQIAGTFPNGNTDFFLPTRAFFGPESIDLCDPSVPFAPCVQGYTDDVADPGQTCAPPQPMAPIPLGTCLPNCDTNAPMCPSAFFTCVTLQNPAPPIDVCVPPM